jgi:NADPH-dependent ferric siderophore reductase
MNHTKKVLEENKSNFDKEFRITPHRLRITFGVEKCKSFLSSSQTNLIKAIIKDIGKMRVYDLEEYSHEEKVENVGFNKALDRIQSNLKELLVGVK